MRKANKSPFRLDTDLPTLRTLVAVVEEGGFSAASHRVHRSQSAISLQIAKLEEQVNTKLLDRTSRSLSLTSAGEIFLNYARRIIELSDEAILAVTAPEEGTLLRVGFAEYLAPQHLHPLLARFRRAHPHCDLSLVLGLGMEMIAKLDQGELDVVFTGPEREDGKVLWQEPLVWAGDFTPTEEKRKPIELVLMHPPCTYRQIASAALSKANFSWRSSIDANSIQAVQSAVRAGLGISVLPLSAVLPDIKIITKGLPALPATSVVYYTQTDAVNPLTDRFVDYLLEGLEGVSPPPPTVAIN